MNNAPQCLLQLRQMLNEGQDYRNLAPEFIQACINAAHDHYEDLHVVRTVPVLELKPGQLVGFIYENPDENPPWRFGIVNVWITGCWNVWTLNLQWKREGGTARTPGRKVACGPGYRSYKVEHMTKVREYGAHAEAIDVTLAEDLARVATDMRKLFRDTFGTRKDHTNQGE